VSVVTEPANSNAIYLATTGGVFFKADQTDAAPWTVGNGGNLQELTGTGPDRLPFQIKKVTLMANRGGKAPALYAATAGGVFKSANPNGVNTKWVRLGIGLPDVLVSDLNVNGETHYVYVSLFGRGVWYLVDYSK
jgi:hypothetical protein